MRAEGVVQAYTPGVSLVLGSGGEQRRMWHSGTSRPSLSESRSRSRDFPRFTADRGLAIEDATLTRLRNGRREVPTPLWLTSIGAVRDRIPRPTACACPCG